MTEQPPPPSPWAPPPRSTALPWNADAVAPAGTDRISTTGGATSADGGIAGSPRSGSRRRLQESTAIKIVSCLLAVGCGAFALLAVDSWLPRRAEAGVVTGARVEEHLERSNGRTRTVTDHVVTGITDSGESWRIVSERVFDIVFTGTRVDLEFSRLSGRVVAVFSPFGRYDQRSVGATIAAAVAPLLGAVAYVVGWRRARRRTPWPRSRHLITLACVGLGVLIGANVL